MTGAQNPTSKAITSLTVERPEKSTAHKAHINKRTNLG